MFLILLTYKKPLNEIDKLVAAHMAWLAEHYATGEFLLSGRKQPRTGGVILTNAHSRSRAEEIAHSDPFVRHDAADCEIVEFIATTTAPALAHLKQL
jgi:uncharacterized protein YciI